MPDHIDPAELAEADEGLLPATRAAEVAAHLESCPECTRTAAELAQIRTLLAGLPVPEMPAALADRLDRVVADEQIRRSSKPEPEAGRHGTSSGALGSGGSPQHVVKRLVLALGALVVVAGLALGGYVATGMAGLNEPPATAAAAVAVSPGQLRELAEAVERRSDLEPHRFSRAWLCARKVTDGAITGLARATLEGRSALLVFLRTDGVDSVTVVTGCESDTPSAAASTTLPR